MERWFQDNFGRALSNRTFETTELPQEELTRAFEAYWENPALLRGLVGSTWWVEAIEAL